MEFEIPSPCEERWEDMEPVQGGRFCGRCRHAVLDLSQLTRKGAERLLRGERGDYACVQLAVGEDGAAIFRPERARGVATGAILAAALGLAGCEASGGEGEAAIESSEPCPIPGPPMFPVGASDNTPDATVDASTFAAAEPEVIEEDDAVPTAEQRALTARKHGPRQVPATRHHPMLRGRMPLHRY
jgi:hypothetical protein